MIVTVKNKKEVIKKIGGSKNEEVFWSIGSFGSSSHD